MSEPTVANPRNRLSWLAPVVLAVVYVGQCLWFVGTQSLVYDEPAHLITGLEAWHDHKFEQWNDQPPLGRLLLTLPLLRGQWQIEKLGQIRPSPKSIAWHARPVNVALGLVLGGLVWVTTRRLFGNAAATSAAGLYAFSPPLIAHFSVATVDGITALMLLTTTVQMARWWRDSSWTQTVLLGGALGGFLIAKFSAPPLVALALGIALLHDTNKALDPRRWNWAKAGVIVSIAFVIVWGAYFLEVLPVTFQNGQLGGPYASPHSIIVPTSRPLHLTIPVPAGDYVTGLGLVIQYSVKGQPSFFLGEVSQAGGWRWYFLVVALLKWPLVVWLLALAAFGCVLWGRLKVPDELLLITLFAAVFFALAVMSNLNIGDRYILPVYPILLSWSAAVVPLVWRRRLGPLLVATVLLLQAADCLRYGPDYLSYFNVFVRPERSYELLTDSNLDWGQGLLALRRYELAHPTERIWLAYFGGVDPAQYGIRALPLPEADRVTGTVIVSATHLSGQYLGDPMSYRWLLQYPQRAVLNHTLHVFEVRPGAPQ